jgi:hypothetical protein
MQEQLELTGAGFGTVAAERPLPQMSKTGPAVPLATQTRRAGSTGHLLRHLAEMTVVMMLGMAVLGGVSQAALTAVGVDYDRVQLEWPAVTGLLMAFNMTLPMVLWMRHRRHSWPYAMEMAVAMFIPVLALTPPLWLGLISGDALSGIQHMAMIPSMLVVMLRRRKELAP